MEPFSIRSQLSIEQFRKAWLRLSFRRPGSLVLSLISVGLAGFCLFDLLSREADFWWLGLLAPVPIGLVVVWGYKRSLDYLKDFPDQLKPVHVHFLEGGVQIQGDFFADHFPWLNVELVREWPDQWAVVTEEQRLYVFNKDHFTEAENTALRERIRILEDAKTYLLS